MLEVVPRVPTPVWGRDELGTGEMWNSNSVIAWVIARSGIDTESIQPPQRGRAPGWRAGVIVAHRMDALQKGRRNPYQQPTVDRCPHRSCQPCGSGPPGDSIPLAAPGGLHWRPGGHLHDAGGQPAMRADTRAIFARAGHADRLRQARVRVRPRPR